MTQQHSHPAQSFVIPRPVLAGMWGLVLFAVTAVALWRLSGLDQRAHYEGAIATRDIAVTDGSDGSVILVDAVTGRSIDTLEPGTSGFVRATLRGLARERKLGGAGPEAPFRLTHWRDGHLTLDDLATSRRIDLGAFGITNAQAFARLMQQSRSIETGEKRQ
jgi:putative photosynthetic complex assembly protein